MYSETSAVLALQCLPYKKLQSPPSQLTLGTVFVKPIISSCIFISVVNLVSVESECKVPTWYIGTNLFLQITLVM